MPSHSPQHGLSNPRMWRVVAVALMMVTLLSGCWPLPQDDTPRAPSTPIAVGTVANGTPGVATPGLVELPRTEGAINIALAAGDPPTLDPALATDAYSLSIIRQLFSGLVTFDSELKVVPDIASGMPSVSGDGKSYTFALRRDVQFTNGQEVTSADFKYSLERAADPRLAGPYAAPSLPAAIYLGDIVGVKEKLAGTAKEVSGIVAPDPFTLVITLDAPKAYFLSKLAAGPSFVVQRSNVESGDAWAEEPRGTGPFKLQKWERNSYMTLARNTDYFGGAPETPFVNIMMGRTHTGDVNNYIAGALDIMSVSLDALEYASDRNSPLSRELSATPDQSVTYIGFNIRQKPFDDPKIREGIAHAIDRQRLARMLFQSRVQAAEGLMLPGLGGYRPLGLGQQYNVTRARQLFAESTYKSVTNVPKLRLFTSGESVGSLISQALSETLGLDVEVREIESSDYSVGLERGDYSLFLGRTDATYPDPEAVLGSLFKSDSPANVTEYRNDDVDALLAATGTEGDAGKRSSAYAQVEQRVLSEYVLVPLYRSVTYTLVKPDLRGVTLTPLGMLSLRNLKAVGR